jgi:2,3-bisphosphoglycerate-dependent phosphoglycerate mutase
VSDNEDQRLPPSGFRQRGPKPSGTRLLLIRHGESYANANGLAGGPLGDGGLTPLGQRQAQVLAARLTMSGELSKTTALYTSALPRAIETGEILRAALPTGLEPVIDDSLNEISVGEGDGLPWAQYVERYGAPDWDLDPDALTAPGGESLLGFYERCRAAIERLVERHPHELVVVVCHGGFIEQAMKLYQGVAPDVRLRPRIENCSMTEIEFRDGWRRLLRYNDRAPLPAE